MTGDGPVSQKLSAFVTQTRPLSSLRHRPVPCHLCGTDPSPVIEIVTQARPLSPSLYSPICSTTPANKSAPVSEVMPYKNGRSSVM